jgi:reprolysin-like metallo-peptidase family M12B/putative Ig domain-containing protein
MAASLRATIVAGFLITGAALFPQARPGSAPATTGSIWRDVEEATIRSTLSATTSSSPRRDIVPQVYRTLQLNKSALIDLLASAPLESSGAMEVTGAELQIPLPSGGFGRFRIQESPIMEPKLAAKFPELKTYVGQGIDDPTATMRIDLTPRGFHAIILSAGGQIYVDPYSRETDTDYISYWKSDFTTDKPFSCATESESGQTEPLTHTAPYVPTGATLRTYRLALAATGEYATAVCNPNPPTVAATLAAMITSVNRCSAVYEREFSIRFLLINNNDKLIYLDGATDPYTNSSGSTMLGQNQSNIDSVIGSANYDFGHVFSTGGGGIASLHVICAAGSKARGVTGSSNPVGDPYDIDYVVHEIGHQFGANHPFNATSGNCAGGNRNGPTAYEVGSGTTIMAYAGICSPQDLAPHSDDYFYTISYDEIDAYTSGGGSSCPQLTATGNTPPSISSLSSFTIPSQTPFVLTASATDPDGDTLTYCWEEFDLGPAQDPTASPRDNGSSPIFRSYPPTTNPSRIFPSLTYILNNQNVPPATLAPDLISGEFLPTTSRTMTYRVTVRDNRAGGGGSNYASTTVASVSTAGPFAITAPNTATTIAGGSTQTVTWNVASTNVSPINCASIKISLSTDGGYTFPTVLASSVPNNGSAVVTIPNMATTQGRIKVEAVGNIFFDISDANFTITSANTAPSVNITGSITVVRGKPTATVATVGTASDAEGNPLTISVSEVPFGATITPGISSGNISLSAMVNCAVVTTLSSRTYPITLTVTDSNGATTSRTVNLVVTPNPSPTLGPYPNITVAPSSSGTSTPAAAAADSNGNLNASPYSVLPTTLPGGGTISVNQTNGIVTAATTAGSTLGTTTVRVTALDSCGAAAVQIFNVTVASINPLPQAGTASAPTAESCSPPNGAPDPGETVTMNFPINNNGGAATTSLVATLQNSGGVTPITTSQNYGAIAASGSASRAFQFTVAGSCGSTVTATLQLQDGATNYGNVTYTIRLGVIPVTLSQNFDAVSPPALPSGWTAVVASGLMTAWATNATSPDTAPNSISATTVDTPSDNRLTSPSVSVPILTPQLSFRHRWNLETGYDGGILEISINGGAFTDIIAAGASFVSGGYNGSISPSDGSPIAGANAWTGNFNSAYTTTVINLPPSAAGQNAQFRWRLACDTGVSVSGAIWRVDTVTLSSSSYVCSTSCSVAPAITNGPPPSLVIVGTPYGFSFAATGNPAPTFSLTSGALPPGITLSSGGALSGTATSAGTGDFPSITVTASNGTLPNAQQIFSLTAVTRVANYLSSYGLTGGNAALLFDYDSDGIVNLMEYALLQNPTLASVAGLPAVIIKNYAGTKYLSITFTRSSVATDLTYTVQGSSDLMTWSDLASSIGGAATSGPGFVSETGPAPLFSVEVRDTVPIDGPPGLKRFLRLKVSSP